MKFQSVFIGAFFVRSFMQADEQACSTPYNPDSYDEISSCCSLCFGKLISCRSECHDKEQVYPLRHYILVTSKNYAA